MLKELDQIKEQGLVALAEAGDAEALETWRVHHLGRSSPVMEVFAKMGAVPKEERPAVGRYANEVKTILETALAEKEATLQEAALAHALREERLDVTLPGRPHPLGRLHPSTRTMREIYRIFGEMGFQVYRSREVETDEFNFQLLNIPPHHPAREMQDTFYIDDPSCAPTLHPAKSGLCTNTLPKTRTTRPLFASSCPECATGMSKFPPAMKPNLPRSRGWQSGRTSLSAI
jgi:phenylalanyl-tRNA synthetase alpha chain